MSSNDWSWNDTETWVENVRARLHNCDSRDVMKPFLDSFPDFDEEKLCEALNAYDSKMEELLGTAVTNEDVFIASHSARNEVEGVQPHAGKLMEGPFTSIFNSCIFTSRRHEFPGDAFHDRAEILPRGDSGDSVVSQNELEGRYADYLRRNWRRQADKSAQVWQEAYSPVSARAMEGTFQSLEDFEREASQAQTAAVKAFGLGVADFWRHASRRIDEEVGRDRARTVLGIAMQELERSKAVAKKAEQAAKDAQRRELKVVLDRTKKMEEQLATLMAAAPAAATPAPAPAPAPQTAAVAPGAEEGGGEGGAAGKSSGGGSGGASAEELKVLRERVEALEKVVGRVEDLEGKMGGRKVGLDVRLSMLEEKWKDSWEASANVAEQVVSLREQISCVGDTAEECSRMGQQVRAMLSETEARLAQALDEKDAAVADRCRAIFELLSKNTQHELAKSEMRTSSELLKSVARLQDKDREMAAKMRADFAVASASIGDVSSRLGTATEEVESLWVKVEQTRDQIQALWKMLEAMPNADNLKEALHEASSYIPGQSELSSMFSSVKRRVSAGVGGVKSAAAHVQPHGTPPPMHGKGRGSHPPTPLPPTPHSDSDCDNADDMPPELPPPRAAGRGVAGRGDRHEAPDREKWR